MSQLSTPGGFSPWSGADLPVSPEAQRLARNMQLAAQQGAQNAPPRMRPPMPDDPVGRSAPVPMPGDPRAAAQPVPMPQSVTERPVTPAQFADLSLPGGAPAAAKPAAVPGEMPGAWKGGAEPRMPSPVGAAALADQRAAEEALRQRIQELAPPPTAFEKLMGSGPAIINELHGHPSHGGYVASNVFGSNGALAARLENQWIEDPAEVAGGLRSAHEDQVRRSLLGAALNAAQQYPHLYQSQAQMADTQMRSMMEFGPMRAAQEIGNGAYVHTLDKTGDYAAASRARTEAMSEFLRTNGGANGGVPAFMQGLLPGAQSTTPEQALAKTMPGAQQGGEQSTPQGGITDEAAMKYLQSGEVLNDKNQALGGDIDAMKLAAALTKNPDLAARGREAITRALLASGVAPDRVTRAVQQAIIRLHQASKGGRTGTYGPYSVSATGDPMKGWEDVPNPPRYTTGFGITSPSGGVWYPAVSNYSLGERLVNPINPWFTSPTERGRAEDRAQATALGHLLAAIEAERARRAAAQAAGQPQR
jgi:hypothetical protein